MELSAREFNAMNHPVRRFLQRVVEYPNFKRMGLKEQGQDILEIGCGSGYGAYLISELKPRSYLGIDLMPEQVRLADRLAKDHDLENFEFRVADATDLHDIHSESKDTVIIFGIMHHIPAWRAVLEECYRVLREGGKLFIEEPDGEAIEKWDRLFHWGHLENALFRLRDLEEYLTLLGFTITKQLKAIGFGFYVARKEPR